MGGEVQDGEPNLPLSQEVNRRSGDLAGGRASVSFRPPTVPRLTIPPPLAGWFLVVRLHRDQRWLLVTGKR